MKPSASLGVWCVCLLFGVHSVLCGSAQQPKPPSFRTDVALVPVDVRVVHREGAPIHGLNVEDFTILEEGRPQKIAFFSEEVLGPRAPATPSVHALPSTSTETASQDHRTFLLVLGRGRLQEPAKGVDALIRFVREQLLPQDVVAIQAWNRATDFTADRERAARVLERFKVRHEEIEALLSQHLSGLRVLYENGRPAIPSAIQAKIDDVFADNTPGHPGVRQMAGVVVDADRAVALNKRYAETALRGEDLRQRIKENPELAWVYAAELAESDLFDLPFDTFTEASASTLDDLWRLYSGIDYLRRFEGEKHLILVTPAGLRLLEEEEDRSLAAQANDARVTISVIQTGGLLGWFPGAVEPDTTRKEKTASVDVKSAAASSFDERFRLMSMKAVARLTGGQVSAWDYAKNGLDRVNTATLACYRLGYYPTDAAQDGRYRRIEVRVNRPGATVLFRHGYFARGASVSMDRLAMRSYRAISAAAMENRPVSDIPIRMKATARRDGGGLLVTTALVIDASKLAFKVDGDRYLARIEIAVFCGDGDDTVVGKAWQTLDLKLREATYQRYLSQGFSHTVRLAADNGVQNVKGVVYDFGSDRVGSVAVPVSIVPAP